MIFALPWYGRTLIGTTDNDFDGDTRHPRPAEAEVEYLLDAANAFFGTALGPGDLVGAYAGVRPLISSGDPRKSVDISRKEELYETSSGMLTITGGKLTTYRRMAKLTVDRLVEREGREAPCQTAEIPLGMEARPADLEAPDEVGEEALSQLAFRYGHAARQGARPGARAAGAGGADRPRPSRPAGRGGAGGAPRAGALARRRAAAAHPAGDPRGAGAARPGGAAADRGGAGRRSWAGRRRGSRPRSRPGRTSRRPKASIRRARSAAPPRRPPRPRPSALNKVAVR